MREHKCDGPVNASSGRTRRSRFSKSFGFALANTESARLRLLSMSPTWGANWRQAILIVFECLALWRRKSCYTESSTSQVSLDVIGRLYPQCSGRYVLEVNASRPFDDSVEYGNMLIDDVNRRRCGKSWQGRPLGLFRTDIGPYLPTQVGLSSKEKGSNKGVCWWEPRTVRSPSG